ncbi:MULTISPECIES: HNH endonuclease [Bradyrhizobium]|uniref:HNH endonuclease n=1 Tax=Bradyrhizobium TaxID=374 RepID=UPI000576D2FC|nr:MULTISPECIES: HNH endonuclease [Bradyrhizobium]MBR1071112.1 HNH endonuclease [Bradyrhizobium liaoningense]
MPARDLARDQLASALEGYPASVAELDAVMALYDAYDAAGGAPSDPLKGLNLEDALRTAIQESYELTQLGRRLAMIRTTLMKNVERCPICGISAPRTLDHYLPKANYHPLAIYVRNLVPICMECNQSKGSTVPVNPAERFIHPYFEPLPEKRFMRANVTIKNGGLIAEFGLDPAAELPDLLVARLSFQLRRLRLNARYAQEINSYLTSQTTGLHICFDAQGPNGVRDYLCRQASVEFRQFHLNHWRPILLLSLSSYNEFCAGAFRDVLPTAQLVAAP